MRTIVRRSIEAAGGLLTLVTGSALAAAARRRPSG